MPLMLSGFTHAIVTTCKKEDFDKTGILAYIDLCFSADDSAIKAVIYKKLENKVFAFQSPNTIQYINGTKQVLTVFSGALDTEVCSIASRAMDQIKKLGNFKFGTRYRVTLIGATEEPLE